MSSSFSKVINILSGVLSIKRTILDNEIGCTKKTLSDIQIALLNCVFDKEAIEQIKNLEQGLSAKLAFQKEMKEQLLKEYGLINQL